MYEKDSVISLCLEYELCPYCGAKFYYSGISFDSHLEALGKKREHISVCPVRFNREQPSQEWQNKLDRVCRAVEIHRKDIAELNEDLSGGVVHRLLKQRAEEIVDEKKRLISDLQKSIGEEYWDYEYEDEMNGSIMRGLEEELTEEFKKEQAESLEKSLEEK